MCCASLEAGLLGSPTFLSVTASRSTQLESGRTTTSQVWFRQHLISRRAPIQVSTAGWSLWFLMGEGRQNGQCILWTWPCSFWWPGHSTLNRCSQGLYGVSDFSSEPERCRDLCDASWLLSSKFWNWRKKCTALRTRAYMDGALLEGKSWIVINSLNLLKHLCSSSVCLSSSQDG